MTAQAQTALAQAQVNSDTLTVAFAAEPATLDPSRITSGVDSYFTSQMFEPLIRFTPDLHREGWLAESWSSGELNGKPIVDVVLRAGVKFHNGDPVTSDDIVFSCDRFRDPRSGYNLGSIDKVEALDERRVRIHLKRADAQFFVDNLVLLVMPKKYFEQVGEQEFAQHPIGTGPWKFVSRKIKDELRLERFNDYWKRDAAPGYANLVIKVIQEDVTRVSAYKTGRVDLIDNVPLALVDEFKALPNTRTVTVPSGNNVFLNFNTQMPNSPFNDLRVRKAVAHAIDLDAIIQKVLFGQGKRYVQVAEAAAGYEPSLKPYAYDQAKARSLLKEAGFPNGFEIPCYNHATPREPNIKEFGEAVYAYLAIVGIRCRVRSLELGAYLALVKRDRGAPGLPGVDGIINWQWPQGLPGDPAQAWMGHLHSYDPGKGAGGYSYSSDPEVDMLLEKQAEVLDENQRNELLKRIAALKNERMLGGLPTYLPIITFAFRDTINWTPWPNAQWRAMQQIRPVK
ncbi:glutathione ABC transporter substrate-binding protein [Bradyrhizobium sp. CCBAU 11386]|nr:glutathione ABC transporter substrate-binding protein [Bradyrhizobium sp. CCBAU 11386]